MSPEEIYKQNLDTGHQAALQKVWDAGREWAMNQVNSVATVIMQTMEHIQTAPDPGMPASGGGESNGTFIYTVPETSSLVGAGGGGSGTAGVVEVQDLGNTEPSSTEPQQ